MAEKDRDHVRQADESAVSERASSHRSSHRAERAIANWAENAALKWVRLVLCRLEAWALRMEHSSRALPQRVSLSLHPLEPRIMLDAAEVAHEIILPAVAGHTPNGIALEPVTSMQIDFSEAMDQVSFAITDDVVSFTDHSSNSIPITGFSWVAPDTLELTFDSLGRGYYEMVIGPQILSLSGDAMDQDGDGTSGEVDEDVYFATMTIIDEEHLVTLSEDTSIADGDATYDGQDIVVDGATVTVDGTHSFHSIEIRGGGSITHSTATTESESRLELTVTGHVIIGQASEIDVSDRGYLEGRTTGNVVEGASEGTSGGSYGGSGGGWSNAVYGDFRNPNELGSGAGPDQDGGTGGGLVRIQAGTVALEGLIAADGQRGYSGYWSAGGGSGGGVWLDVGVLTGHGELRACGGGKDSSGGGGGGGRIALHYGDMTGFTGTCWRRAAAAREARAPSISSKVAGSGVS